MNISFAFSPCPNDTFIFGPIVNKNVTCNNFNFEYNLFDVEELNQAAFIGRYDVTKLSFGVYPKVSHVYDLLDSGSALGNNCGPLLVCLPEHRFKPVEEMTIATPGANTTANLLLKKFYPNLGRTSEMLFSEIENAVVEKKVDAGLIIHENRFTYESNGLVKIVDLGEKWQLSNKLPIPLGGIFVRKSLSQEIKSEIQNIIQTSVNFAFNNPKINLNYIKKYAQTMSEEVMFAHINLYVNDFTKSLGHDGVRAINKLLNMETDPIKGIL